MFGSLSMWEILLILIVALIVFGPRKLPDLGRSLGESLAQFRKASEDFKRSWEEEIKVEDKRLSQLPSSPPVTTSESEQPREFEQS
jgi:TatA/E family protein of Tat protein translocase